MEELGEELGAEDLKTVIERMLYGVLKKKKDDFLLRWTMNDCASPDGELLNVTESMKEHIKNLQNQEEQEEERDNYEQKKDEGSVKATGR